MTNCIAIRHTLHRVLRSLRSLKCNEMKTNVWYPWPSVADSRCGQKVILDGNTVGYHGQAHNDSQMILRLWGYRIMDKLNSTRVITWPKYWHYLNDGVSVELDIFTNWSSMPIRNPRERDLLHSFRARNRIVITTHPSHLSDLVRFDSHRFDYVMGLLREESNKTEWESLLALGSILGLSRKMDFDKNFFSRGGQGSIDVLRSIVIQSSDRK
jgi:hypothetical protein